MRRIASTRKVLASILAATVWSFCSISAPARELGPIASLEELLAPQAPPAGSAWRATLGPAPRAVAGEVGQVSWTRLARASSAWNCRTGEGSGVTVDLAAAGKIAISERSSVNLRTAGDAVVVTLLGGAVTLEGARDARVETFDGVYVLEPGRASQVRFAWRDGALAQSGGEARKEAGSEIRLSDLGLTLQPVEASRAARGKRMTSAVRVTDPAGRPVAGVPVVFAAAARSGAAVSPVLTDEAGVAETNAAARGGSDAVAATIPGTEASAVVPDAGRTTGGQKVMAVVVLGVLGAITAVMVAKALDKDDPKLTAGTPALVR